MFDHAVAVETDTMKFAAGAEQRLHVIAHLLGLKRSGPDGRYALQGTIPYFVHHPNNLSYGNVEFQGLDVPAPSSNYDSMFYQHEEAHAVLNLTAGAPPSLFNEGFACYASRPGNTEAHRCAAIGLRHCLIPPLSKVACTKGFWQSYRTHKPFMYRMAGSFAAWLFVQFGHKPFVAFAGRCGFEDKQPKVLRDFRNAYGYSLANMDHRWRNWLLSSFPASSRNGRVGNLSQAEWERTRVEMVHNAL